MFDLTSEVKDPVKLIGLKLTYIQLLERHKPSQDRRYRSFQFVIAFNLFKLNDQSRQIGKSSSHQHNSHQCQPIVHSLRRKKLQKALMHLSKTYLQRVWKPMAAFQAVKEAPLKAPGVLYQQQ